MQFIWADTCRPSVPIFVIVRFCQQVRLLDHSFHKFKKKLNYLR
jgi:hypothetical protein